MNTLARLGAVIPVASAPFNIASGVAVVLPSNVQVVICTGHDASKNALAIKAGLTIFCPIPPKNCLATIIAKNPPTIGSQIGAATGILKANKSPVTTALRSHIVTFLFVAFCQIYSAKTQDITDTAISIAALPLKK